MNGHPTLHVGGEERSSLSHITILVAIICFSAMVSCCMNCFVYITLCALSGCILCISAAELPFVNMLVPMLSVAEVHVLMKQIIQPWALEPPWTCPRAVLVA